MRPPGADRDAWCEGCEYSEPVHEPEGMLRCRRHAPRPTSGGVEPTQIVWPLVAPEDWCGDYLPRMSGGDEDPLSNFTRGDPNA